MNAWFSFRKSGIVLYPGAWRIGFGYERCDIMRMFQRIRTDKGVTWFVALRGLLITISVTHHV